MNKGELLTAIAEEADVTKAVAAKVLDATLSSIIAALRDGDQVNLVGFGSFIVRERQEREGINPKTREKMMFKASKSPSFKAGKAFKDMLN